MRTFAAFFVALALAAQTPLRKGEVIDRVEVRDHPGQSYALYVPNSYTPDRDWPILYCLDPGGRGRAPVERFAAAAEKAGVIVAGSNNSRNGPIAPSQEAINLMLADTHDRFRLDDARLYAAGLSGGAQLALSWGMGGHLAGVVASGAGFAAVAAPRQVPFRAYFTTGYDDFNHDELYRLSRELAARKIAHRYAEFEGGHEWLPASLTEEALAYLAGSVPDHAAEPSKSAEREAGEYQRRYQEIEAAGDAERASLIHQLQKEAARPADSSDRRVARRIAGSLSIGSMEQAREAMSQHQYSDAARYAGIGVLVRPENANGWYTLAVAQAGAGNTKRALEALEQAMAHGFRARDRIEAEPLLEKVRREKKYTEIMSRR